MFDNIFPVKLKNNDELIDKLLNKKILFNKNFGDIHYGKNIWECGPQENRTWKWFLNSFLFLDPLLAEGMGEESYQIVWSWWERFKFSSLSDDFPWHDHATALRLDRLCRLALNPQFKESLVEIAAFHARALMREDFYSKHTNHGFDQSLSLMLVALVFSDHEEAEGWRETGFNRLVGEIGFAFTEEGVHVENSPAYHFGMIGNMVRARNLLKIANNFKYDFDVFFDKALYFLAWVTRPDRFIAYIGDSASYRPSLAKELLDLPSASAVQWVATAGKAGEEPRNNFVVFEKSGYAIYRSSWRPDMNQTHVIMKSGFLSKYHRQDDDLNILIHAYGEDWLIDSGLYNHNQRDPIRIYMRSVRAHNVPYIPGVSMDRVNFSKDFSFVKEVNEPGFLYAFEGSTNMYKEGVVRRRVMIKDENEIKIKDVFLGFDEKEKFWLFHFPKDKIIKFEEGKIFVVGKNKRLVIRTSDVDVRMKKRVGLDDKFPSFESKTANVVTDSQVVVVGPSKNNDVIFDLVFENTN